jgi:two-component system OmpR family sensor kinase
VSVPTTTSTGVRPPGRGRSIGPDRPEALEDLRRENAELMEAVRARDEFLAIAAHELRNPITPILGQIQLLLRAARSGRASPERILQGLEKLDFLAVQLSRRATTFLDISRFNAGKFRLNAEEVDLSRLVRAMAETHALVARYADCPIELQIQDDVVGLWDRAALEEIVDNLLSNAIKYGAGRPLELCLARDKTVAVLSLRDHGAGISKDDQARIFGKFERLFNGRQRPGFGVGLWVVRKLVDAMKAKIIVSSRLGEGATFTVILPLQQTKAQA